MADQVRLTLNTREFARTLTINAVAFKDVAAKALNRTSFEVLEDLKREALRAFPKASPAGKALVSGRGSFTFSPAKRDRLFTVIVPGGIKPGATGKVAAGQKTRTGKIRRILAEHERGGTIVETDARLGLRNKDLLAIPTGARRGTRGRVPTSLQPARLLANARKRRVKGRFAGTLEEQRRTTRGRRVFVAMSSEDRGAILERKGRGSGSRLFSLYALVSRATLPRVFHWEETVTRSARYWLPRKMAEEVGRFKARSLGGSVDPRR